MWAAGRPMTSLPSPLVSAHVAGLGRVGLGWAYWFLSSPRLYRLTSPSALLRNFKNVGARNFHTRHESTHVDRNAVESKRESE
ncbi:hypothetical protein E2C01_034383 [Portunus trituberculatus]|uniref:Uncharacterized protein n=1 Tax=Portunus trituberculatus TaxID=210409 RepID=A0A5B7F8D7_PORTR|nr:hypothetical protein [Portunus trituberculatus]